LLVPLEQPKGAEQACLFHHYGVYVSPIKNSPRHDLSAIKEVFSDTKSLNITGSALRDAAALGYGSEEIVEVIQSMEPGHFYKAMPSEKRPGYWQDVYRVPDGEMELYVKFNSDTVTEFKLLSFKER
jgi:motility quorum-sensing regulator / GCU-specific mRNA interferase toxin